MIFYWKTTDNVRANERNKSSLLISQRRRDMLASVATKKTLVFSRSCDIVALQPNINEVNGLQSTVYRQQSTVNRRQTKYIDKWQMTTIIFEHKCPQIIHKYPLIIQISLLQILFTVIYGAIHDYLCFILTLAVSTFSTPLYSLYFLFTLSTSTSVVSCQLSLFTLRYFSQLTDIAIITPRDKSSYVPI